jgi:hypothetical protein
LKAILFDHALDAPSTDADTGLAELLSDDIDGSVGIEEAVTNDLSFDLFGPDRLGLGSTFLILEAEDAPFIELQEHLMIALSSNAMLLGRLRSAELFAFSLDEHEQARSDLVAGRDEKVASGSDDAPL